MHDVDVLVVGAGPVGLALAIELGGRGVRVLVVERGLRGGQSPRAKTTNVRTRTHLRRWGIAERLAEASPFGRDYPNDVKFVTSLAGRQLAQFDNAFNGYPDRADDYPEHAQWVPQYTLERVLLEHARSLPGVEIRFGTTFLGAEQDGDGVIASIESGGAPQTLRSAYMVGADGARSGVRELIGATMEGRSRIARAYNIIFRAPGLAEAHSHGPAIIYWQLGREGPSIVGPMDRDDVWFFVPAFLGPDETLSDAQAVERIREATGIDLPYEILSADIWYANELIADRYRAGRIFLAGDACHLHPPFGGYGMNMGVGDAVDLGWKIAATLAGWGGPALLDSYEMERRPVHRAVIDEAIGNMAAHERLAWTEGLEAESPDGEAARLDMKRGIEASRRREFATLGTVLGIGYGESPLIASEPGAAAPHDGERYRPDARPGNLAPHAWLADGSSLYDHFGQGFALVAARDVTDADLASPLADAGRRSIPLSIVRPDGVDVRSLYGAALALVRPDQHVAWRGDQWRDVLGSAAGWATL